MKPNDFSLGKKLRRVVQDRISKQEPDFDALWARTRRVRPFHISRAVAALAGVAAVLLVLLGVWPMIFPSPEELAFKASIKSLAQEILPLNPPQVHQDTEASWMSSVLDPDSHTTDF